jgi:hypothetical protein
VSRLLPLAAFLLAAACPAVEVLPMWWTDPTAPGPELGFDDGSGKPRPIRILRLCPLETTRGRAGEVWTLLRKVPPAEPGLPTTWKPYVQTRLPEGSEKLALLLVPSSPPQALAVEISERAHAWGSARLVNLTGGPVQGWVGKRTFTLQPGGQVASEAAAERRTEEVVMMTPVPGGQPRVLFSSRLILDPSRRSLIFVARLANGSVETRALEDSRNLDPVAEPAPKARGQAPATSAR